VTGVSEESQRTCSANGSGEKGEKKSQHWAG